MNGKLALFLGLVTAAANTVSAGTVDRVYRGEFSDSGHHSVVQTALEAFDGSSDTKWLTDASTGWIQIGFRNDMAYVIDSYAIISADDESSRDPRSWTLQGSNDGENWTDIDSRSDESWSGRKVSREFDCSTNTTAYSMYRLDVTQNNGNATLLQLAELELFEKGVSRSAYSKIAASSQHKVTEGGLMAFDGLTNTKWLTETGDITPTIQCHFLDKRAYAINTYAITSANDDATRDPKDWTLEGSNDGENWVVLDTRTGESWEDRYVRHEFAVENSLGYSYYKLDITANNGSTSFVQFSELELLEVTPDGTVEYVSPIEEAEEVAKSTTLNWNAGTADNIAGYYVYLGTAPDVLALQNGEMLAKESTGYDLELESDLTYYWQIEEACYTDPNGLSGVIYGAGDPNNVTAGIWHFSTVTSRVSFDTEYPVNSCVHIGESATFMVAAEDPLGGTIEYQWYFDVDPETAGDAIALSDGDKYSGCNSDTLTVNDAQYSDEGVYYCTGVNASNYEQYSGEAKLVIKQQVAHWDLDSAEFDGTYYADISGNSNDAEVVGTPVFADGIADGDNDAENAVSEGAVYMTAIDGSASAGAFDPSAETGMFTVASWVKRENIINEVAFNIIASKRDGWSASDQSYWQFLTTTDGVVRMQSYGVSTINSPALITADEWHHVAVAYADSVATIYVDGLDVASGTFILADGADSTFWIGRNDSEGERFEGSLDDMQVFNYALTPEEIVGLYYAETGKAVCIYGNPQGDANSDCVVDLLDMAIMAGNWLETGFYPDLN